MDALRDVMAHICTEYPYASELSKARLTKMVYLSDWEAALRLGRQITGIRWVFYHYGPYVEDVADLARRDPAFTVGRSTNMYGYPKDVIAVSDAAGDPDLSPEVRAILDGVIAQTKQLNWKSFIDYVYATSPVRGAQQYSHLDLVRAAREQQSEP